MFLLYLDPSGDSGWPKPYGKSPYNHYVMSGLAVRSEYWSIINISVQKLLISYFTDKPKIPKEIHYTEIIAKRGAWGYLSENEWKAITNDLIDLLLKVKPVLFATVVKKKEHFEKYTAPEPVSQLALRYTVTRFSRFLNRIKDHGIIIYDTESGRSDINIRNFILKSREKGIIHQGDELFNSMARYRTQDKLGCIIESIFFIDSQTSPIIQLTDFCSHSIFSHFQFKKSYRYDKIEPLFDKVDNEIYGLKIWP